MDSFRGVGLGIQGFWALRFCFMDRGFRHPEILAVLEAVVRVSAHLRNLKNLQKLQNLKNVRD